MGERDQRIGYECLEGYAQPIVASDCPVPVDSHYERRAFGTLRSTLTGVGSGSSATPRLSWRIRCSTSRRRTAPAIRNFLIRARRGGDELRFVVEVMRFDRPEYLRGKEVTHPWMQTIGTL